MGAAVVVAILGRGWSRGEIEGGEGHDQMGDVVSPPRVRPSVAAKMFGVSVRTLWRLEEAGKIGKVERTRSGARRYSAANLAKIAARCRKARHVLGKTGRVRVEVAIKRAGMTVGQAALVFGVHVRTLQRWEKEGKFGPLPRDERGVRRFRLKDLNAVEKLVYGGKGRKPPWLEKKPSSDPPAAKRA